MSFLRKMKIEARYALFRRYGLRPSSAKAIANNRRLLAARYIKGSGIEIGALTRPLQLPSDVKVAYVDRLPESGLHGQYDGQQIETFVAPDIVDDAQTLATIPDRSQDFVIVNHVVEHLENPILFFRNAARVLRPQGVLYMALPDKEFTFDRDRPVTPFAHLVRDYEQGPEWSRLEHFREFVRLADLDMGTQAWRTEEEYEAQVQRLLEMDYSIHFHVWDRAAMIEMMLRARADFHVDLEIDAVMPTGDETVLICRQRKAA